MELPSQSSFSTLFLKTDKIHISLILKERILFLSIVYPVTMCKKNEKYI